MLKKWVAEKSLSEIAPDSCACDDFFRALPAEDTLHVSKGIIDGKRIQRILREEFARTIGNLLCRKAGTQRTPESFERRIPVIFCPGDSSLVWRLRARP
jgi:hypothetical protein